MNDTAQNQNNLNPNSQPTPEPINPAVPATPPPDQTPDPFVSASTNGSDVPPAPPPSVIGGNLTSSGPNPGDVVEPSFIPTYPKQGSGNKRLLGAFMGLLVLAFGITAGTLLVQQNQDIRERAAECKDTPGSYCELRCHFSKPDCGLGTGQKVPCNTVVGADSCEQVDCFAPGDVYQQVYSIGNCGGDGGSQLPKCQRTTDCHGQTCTNGGECVVKDGRGEFPDDPSKWKWGCRKDPDCEPDKTPKPTKQPTPPGESPPPTTPGTPFPETAQCLSITVYDSSWNVLTPTQLSSLKAGDVIRVSVSGNPNTQFDQARFIINGTTRPAVSQKKPQTEEFYDEYTIPADASTFSVNVQLHHVTLDWI